MKRKINENHAPENPSQNLGIPTPGENFTIHRVTSPKCTCIPVQYIDLNLLKIVSVPLREQVDFQIANDGGDGDFIIAVSYLFRPWVPADRENERLKYQL